MSDLKHRNLGRFYITQANINSHYETVRKVMATMVVVEARFVPEKDRYHYVAISSLFEAVEEGRVVPSYNLKFEHGSLVALKVTE